MAKDCNGKELNVGDAVTHLWGSWPRGETADWGEYKAEMQRKKIPSSKYLLSDGFDGTATVVHVHQGSVEIEHPGMRGRIPVFASSYCKLES